MTDINENEIAEKLSAMKLELRNINEITPDPLNTKNHPDKQIEMIAQSMAKRWTNPILIDDEGVIVAGHGRRLAALKLGIQKVPVIVLHNLTEAERIQYQIFDNKSAEMAEWNFENLQKQIDRLMELGADIEGTGWSIDELNDELAEMDDEPKEVNVEKLDNAPEVPETVRSSKGDVWICGNHRIMCGDSTEADDVDKLMQGEMADLVFTDPPYGVSYKGVPAGLDWQKIKNDGLRGDELFLFLCAVFQQIARYLRKDRAFYIWFASANHVYFETAIKAAGLKPKQEIIWEKGMVLGYADYHWSQEPCFYGCHEGQNNKWFGDRKQKTFWKTNDTDYETWPREQLLEVLEALKAGRDIWPIKKDSASTYVHPTQKPVELAQRAMINSSLRNEIVLDLFGGSGSTMIAAENMGRRARLMELDPRYVDVEVKRWQDLFGGRARRESDGKLFDEIEGRAYDSYNQE